MRRSIALLAFFMLTGGLALPAVAAEPDQLQTLIDATEEGGVLMLAAGTYSGPVVIDHSMEVRGEGWPTIDGQGVGNVITITAPDVKLTGLRVINTGDSLDRENAGVSGEAARMTIVNNRFENVLFGIFLRRGEDSVIADNVIGAMDLELGRRGDGIRLWESSNTIVERNVVDGGRDTVVWFSNDVVFRDNTVTNGRYGIHSMYSDGILMERNYLGGNSVGGFLMYSFDLVMRDNLITDSQGPSGYGIGLKDMDGVEASGNRFIGNRIGIYFDNSPATPGVEHHFTDNLFAYNQTGAAFLPSVNGNVFSGNAFVDNGEQVGVHGKGVFEGNTWTVGNEGNYWSDFAGYDADRDGVGDIPYRLVDLFSTMTDSNPTLQFFDETPASKAVDLAAHMFPTFRPRPKVEDTSPLMEVPSIPVAVSITSQDPSVLPTIAAALAMLVVAAALLTSARAPMRKVRS